MLAVAEMKQVEAWLSSWSGYEGGHTNQSLEGRTEVEWVAEDGQVNDLARVIAAELSLTVWESGSDVKIRSAWTLRNARESVNANLSYWTCT